MLTVRLLTIGHASKEATDTPPAPGTRTHRRLPGYCGHGVNVPCLPLTLRRSRNASMTGCSRNKNYPCEVADVVSTASCAPSIVVEHTLVTFVTFRTNG